MLVSAARVDMWLGFTELASVHRPVYLKYYISEALSFFLHATLALPATT